MANGRVITGFSKPYVAKYAEEGGTVSYSDGMPLARGVEVQIEPDTTEDNRFYADNIIAESEAGVFTGGTLTLTVDGLKDEANKLVYGLPTASEAGWTDYGNTQKIPFIGVGFVVRYMENNVESFVPIILTKTLFNESELDAATQEDQIDWQTQELTAQIFRDDSATQVWKRVGTAVPTEAAAEDKVKTALGIS